MMSKSKFPQIRFRGFSGEWEVKKLGDICTSFSGGTPMSTNKAYYSGNIPFIGSGKINSHSVEQYITNEALENSSAKMVEEGDLLFALYGATSGEVGISKIKGAINQAVLCLRTKENRFFLFKWLQKNKEDILATYLQGGQGNLSAQIIKDLKPYLPEFAEQTKIGSYFQQLDKLIEQKEKKYQKLKQFKKAMLDKMFPKNEADTPEIRFRGFSEKWEEKRLIEFSNLVHGDGDWILTQDITINGEYKIVQLGNIGLGKYIKKDLKTVSQKTFEDLRGTPIKRGDLLINRMVDGNVNSCIFELDGNYITSVDVCWIRKNEYINNYFLMCLLTIEESQRKLLSLSSGSGRIRISKKNLFEKFNFLLPTIEEQIKTGNYFQKLDNQINLQQKELEKLKNIKKASLSKMFV